MELQKLYVTLMLDAADFKTGMAAVTGAVGIAVAATTAAVAKVAIDGVNAAKDMEAQMSNIAAVFGKTTDEIAPLGDLIKDLGLDPGLKVDAVQAADAIEMLARNGLTMGEIMDGAAKATVLLANSTGAEFATAANIGTDAMAIFGIEAQDMLTAVDGITAVTTNSKFSINDYALALAQGGGVAATVGVEFNDFNTAIAGISPLFKSGSDAGTSFKTMLTRLNPTTTVAKEAMAELGLITEDGSSAFYDAEGNMQDMAHVAGIMAQAFGPLTEEQRALAMQTIFGADAMRAAAGMMELGEEGFRSLTATMSQTDALAAAATRMDNLSGAMEIFEGIVDTVVLSIGQALLPVIRMFVDWLIVMADIWMPKIEAAMAIFNAVLIDFFTLISEGMTPLDALYEALDNFIPVETLDSIFSIIDAISEFIAKVWEAIQPITSAIAEFVSWKDVLIAVGIAVAATLIPILIGFIATLASVVAPILVLIAIVAALRTAWETDFAGIRDFVAAVWDAIQQAFHAFRLLFQGDVDGFLEAIGAAWETGWTALVEFIGNLWSIVKPILADFFVSVIDWFNSVDWEMLGATAIELISRGFEALWDMASTAFNSFWDSVKGWVSSIDWASIGQAIMTGIANGIKAGASKIINAARSAAMAAFNAAKAAMGIGSPSKLFAEEVGEPISQGIAVGIINGADAIVSAMGEVADKLANSDAVKKYAETVSKVAGSLVDVVKAFDAMANVTWLGDFGKTFDALNWLINYMVEGMEHFASTHGEDSLKAVQVYADTAKKVSGAIVDAGKALEAMANIVWPGDFGKTFDAINWLINYMVTGMTNFAVTHGEAALKHVQTYADTAKKVAGALVDVQKAFDAINNMVFPTEFDTKLQIMHTALGKMVNSIKSMDLLLAPAAVALVQAIADRTGVAATAIGKIVDNIIAGIKHLDNLVQSNVAGSISQLLRQMLSIISATVPAAYSAGTEIGQSIGQGITDALEMSLPDFLKPAHAGGGATLVMEGGVRTVVLENGAFQVTINDTMDAEEFKFSVVQILRELTE